MSAGGRDAANAASQCASIARPGRKRWICRSDRASFALVVYEALQGYCRHCCHYETVRPLHIFGAAHSHAAAHALHQPALPLAAVQRVCELVPVPPMTAYRYDRYILQTELPAPNLDGIEALLIDEKHLGRAGFVTLVLNARTGELLWLAEGRGKDALDGFFAKLTAAQKGQHRRRRHRPQRSLSCRRRGPFAGRGHRLRQIPSHLQLGRSHRQGAPTHLSADRRRDPRPTQRPALQPAEQPRKPQHRRPPDPLTPRRRSPF
ncbi:MAG: hypothetical protein WCK17_08940 [Verrucomicrobiota bacterium]